MIVKRADRYETAWEWHRAHQRARAYWALLSTPTNMLAAFMPRSELLTFVLFGCASLVLVSGVSLRMRLQNEPAGYRTQISDMSVWLRTKDIVVITTIVAALLGTVLGLLFSYLPVARADNAMTSVLVGLCAGLFYLVVSLSGAARTENHKRIEAMFEKEKDRLAKRMAKYGY